MEGGGSREALLGFLRLKCVKYVAPYPNVFSHILLNTICTSRLSLRCQLRTTKPLRCVWFLQISIGSSPYLSLSKTQRMRHLWVEMGLIGFTYFDSGSLSLQCVLLFKFICLFWPRPSSSFSPRVCYLNFTAASPLAPLTIRPTGQ